MQFSAITVLAGLSAFATAATIPTESRSTSDVTSAPIEAPVQERQVLTALVGVVITAAATELGTLIVQEAVTAAGDAINKAAKDFISGRQQFTQATTLNMFNNNPNPQANVATICQNQGYTVSNPANMHNLVSAKLTSGLLHVDFDCFYMSAPNTFTPSGDGGFENVAVRLASNCNRDSGSGVVTCT